MICFILLLSLVESKKRNGKVSSHDYLGQSDLLNDHRVSCGYKGSDLDLSRVAAQSGLNTYPCGTCIKINNKKDKSKSEYFIVVDNGGVNFDLSTVLFETLFGKSTGIFEAEWEKAPESKCKGYLKH